MTFLQKFVHKTLMKLTPDEKQWFKLHPFHCIIWWRLKFEDFPFFLSLLTHAFKVKIDSTIWSFCLHHYVQNGLSYSGKETRLTLCINDAKPISGVKDLRWNKHQLLHRITSIKTPIIYNTFTEHFSNYVHLKYQSLFRMCHLLWSTFWLLANPFKKMLLASKMVINDSKSNSVYNIW